MKWWRTLFVCTVMFASAVGAARADTLRSHSAIYAMKLAHASLASKISDASGTMYYRFERQCGGWIVENRTLLRLSYFDRPSVDTVWNFTSWESDDGTEFRFRTRYEQNGRQVESIRGVATRPDDGGPGVARFQEPEEKTVELPAGTLFPTEHMRQVIEGSVAGEHFLERVVFDGPSPDNPFTVTAFMGPLPEAAAARLAEAAELEPAPVWWTQMSYHPFSTRDMLPEFEIGARYRADGIADNVVQNFEDFALSAELSKLELLPKPDC